MSFIVCDNREIIHDSFDVEASMGSYHRFNASTIAKLLAFQQNHFSWVPKPDAIIMAASPERCRLVTNPHFNTKNISELLDAKYTCPYAGRNLANQTWGVFLVDAMKILTKFLLTNSTKEKRVSIVIFSSDASLMGDRNQNESIDTVGIRFYDGIKLFSDAVNTLGKSGFKVEINIVCAQVSQVGTYAHQTSTALDIQDQLKAMATSYTIVFDSIINSALHYEEQLRKLISIQRPLTSSTLNLPFANGMRSNVHLQLSPSSTASADSVHSGLAQLDLLNLTPRSGINPLCIEGCALKVTAAKRNSPVFSSNAR